MTSSSPRGLLATASVAVALAAADTYVVVLALPDMMTGVGLSIDALQRAAPIVSGFLLGYVAVLPLIGRLADLVERRRILVGCLIVFVVGSAVTALATDLPTLVGGRVVQGVGGGGLVPATLALVADLWPPGRRGLPLGVVSGVQELGSVLGPVIGAVVLTVATWRSVFWVNAVAGAVLAVLVIRLGRPEPGARGPVVVPTAARCPGAGVSWSAGAGVPGRSRKAAVVGLGGLGLVLGALALIAPERLATDVTLGVPFIPIGGSGARLLTPIGIAAALVLVAAGLLAAPSWWPVLRRADPPGALLVGLVLGCVVVTFAAADPAREVVGPLGWALLPLAVVATGLGWWRHRVAAEPLVPRGALTARAAGALTVSALVGVALVAVVVDVPVLARLGGDDQVGAAFVLLRFLVAVPVGAVLGGWLLRWVGAGTSAAAGLVAATAGLILMSGWGPGDLGVGATAVLALVGAGLGFALAPVNAAALAGSAPDHHGTATALVVVARIVGMVVGLALLTAVGLHRYDAAVRALPDQSDPAALVDAAVVQVRTVLLGAAVATGLAAASAAVGLGLRRRGPSRPEVPARVAVGSHHRTRG